MLKEFVLQPWRNWYTRSTKDAVEQSLGVQVPPVAPKNPDKIFNFLLAQKIINLLTFS